MEHVTDPARVYSESCRVHKPGGHLIIVAANLWGYASIIAKQIPNRFHSWIVSKTEGREERHVFPVAYRTNTRGVIEKWGSHAGFEIVSFRNLGHYSSYFMFNGFLLLLATAYEKLMGHVSALTFLQDWIFVTLRKPETSTLPCGPSWVTGHPSWWCSTSFRGGYREAPPVAPWQVGGFCAGQRGAAISYSYRSRYSLGRWFALAADRFKFRQSPLQALGIR